MAAMEPPPAPMVCTSRAGIRIGSPATRRWAAGSGRPPRIRHTSVLVPPMSKLTQSGNPAAAAAGRGGQHAAGRARQEQPDRAGGGLGQGDQAHRLRSSPAPRRPGPEGRPR